MHLIISSAKWRPFCPGEDELTGFYTERRPLVKSNLTCPSEGQVQLTTWLSSFKYQYTRKFLYQPRKWLLGQPARKLSVDPWLKFKCLLPVDRRKLTYWFTKIDDTELTSQSAKIGLGNGLVPSAITWANVDTAQCWQGASLNFNGAPGNIEGNLDRYESQCSDIMAIGIITCLGPNFRGNLSYYIHWYYIGWCRKLESCLVDDIKNNAWVTVNNDFLVTSEVICQWFSLVTKSRVKIIGKLPHEWPKNRYSW